jgi:hypothetical protein
MRLRPPNGGMTQRFVRSDEVGLAVVRGWLDAFNRRDADGLVRRAHPAVTVYPTKLFRQQDCYVGHDGLRQWIAEIVAKDIPESVLVAEFRRQSSGEILATGEITIHGRPVSPVAGLFALEDGLVLSARSYLSDEQTMRNVGHVDG